MVQKFVFDPQTLIDEEKEKEKNKVKKVLSEQEEFDKKVEEEIYGSIVKTQIVEYKEEQPKYFICKNKNKDPFYIKFHITDKKWFDYDKLKWVTGTVRRNDKVYEGATPTLEAHKNRERFSNIIFNKKMFPIFSSEKYYVFYEEKNDGFFWGGSYEPYATNIIIDRFSLNILEVKNKKLHIITTDLDLIFHDEISDLKVDQEGSTTTSATVLYDLLRKLPSNLNVIFDLQSENKLNIFLYFS